jgi:YidC/Oxa1 family membrane protein insertase
MEENNRNFILAIVLSIIVLVGWDMFYTRPHLQKAKQEEQMRQALEKEKTGQSGAVETTTAGGAPASNAAPAASGAAPAPALLTRDEALKAWSAQRVVIDTSSLSGSVALKGARIDDLVLKKFHATVQPTSANVVLLSPVGTPDPFFAEYGWRSEAHVKLPDSNTEWKAENNGPLTTTNPLKLIYDNGEGLVFRQTISIDDNYMFAVTQQVENKGGAPVALKPYGMVARHDTPVTAGLYLLHEGLIGVLGEDGLQEITYSSALKNRATFKQTGGWLGFTDKYWAAALIPDQKIEYNAEMAGQKVGGKDRYLTDFVAAPMVVSTEQKQTMTSHLFAGAKQVELINRYEAELGVKRFDLVIDWGWFYFFTKPMFVMLDFFYKLVGNFGLSILIVTVAVKALFFPLANRAAVSMSRMKKVQPEVERIRERYGEDKMRQQQAIMELYKKENVNPLSGCLPILIQIPVFFSLYKVLYTTIEMRQAPFFGWIHDLSMPDPTTVFNLFGLVPWMPPSILPMLGVWPLLMGVSMFVQQRLNPTPTDPIQAQMFTWMPVMFTFMLASFPAGLVIYWTWNNTLTIIQQWVIMRREGVEVKLWENIGFSKKSANSTGKT